MERVERRLVILVRADPVICGHSGEARNLAESAAEAGYTDVRILTWPMAAIEAAGLPTKPRDAILPYSEPIVVERPPPVGDYRVPDGRYNSGLKGRLIELFMDGMETVVLSMYLLPHTPIVAEAIVAARAAGIEPNVKTIAEAVGSDITNVIRQCIDDKAFGAAIYLFSTYLSQDVCAAVSEYTRKLIIEGASQVDAACGTRFAERCRERVVVSYPAIDTRSFVEIDPAERKRVLKRRNLKRNGYILFLSRISQAKGVEDLVVAYRKSEVYGRVPLVVAGSGPGLADVRALVAEDPHIRLMTDVDDDEKKALMHGCSAYVLPSKPRPEFIETFGIALAEKMLVGGRGPVLTTDTGGIPEAVGDGALSIRAGDVESIREALEYALLEMTDLDKQRLARRALKHALQFDRRAVFHRLMARTGWPPPQPLANVVGG